MKVEYGILGGRYRYTSRTCHGRLFHVAFMSLPLSRRLGLVLSVLFVILVFSKESQYLGLFVDLSITALPIVLGTPIFQKSNRTIRT